MSFNLSINVILILIVLCLEDCSNYERENKYFSFNLILIITDLVNIMMKTKP